MEWVFRIGSGVCFRVEKCSGDWSGRTSRMQPDQSPGRGWVDQRDSHPYVRRHKAGCCSYIMINIGKWRLRPASHRSLFVFSEALICLSYTALGRGGRIRTGDMRLMRPLPYHLATPRWLEIGKRQGVTAGRADAFGRSCRWGRMAIAARWTITPCLGNRRTNTAASPVKDSHPQDDFTADVSVFQAHLPCHEIRSISCKACQK